MFDSRQAIQIAEFVYQHPHVRTGQIVEFAFEHRITNYTGRMSDAKKLGYVFSRKQVSRRESEYTVSARPGETQLSI